MKIFLDTADTEVIRKYFQTGLIDGVTTNPTLIRKSGRDPEDVYAEIDEIGIEDISMEVMGNAQEMTDEGIRLDDKFGYCSTIKVPCTRDGLLACKNLLQTEVSKPMLHLFSVQHKQFLQQRQEQLMSLLLWVDWMINQ